MRFLRKLFYIALIPFLLSGASLYAADTKTQKVKKIDLNTTDGELIEINVTKKGFIFDKYKGKTVLLDFFGPMCPPCLIEIPHLIKMQEENKDKFQIIGVQVQVQMTNKELNNFKKENKINYPLINLDYAWDIVSFIKANTGWGGQIPYMLLFDKSGDLKQQYIGMTPNKNILKYIK